MANHEINARGTHPTNDPNGISRAGRARPTKRSSESADREHILFADFEDDRLRVRATAVTKPPASPDSSTRSTTVSQEDNNSRHSETLH